MLPRHVSILDDDPELAALVAPDRLGEARAASVAAVASVPRGPCELPALEHDAFGLLVLDGVLVRRSEVSGRHGAEVVGRGDLLRPWQLAADSASSVPVTTDWRALSDCRVAVLDRSWLGRMSEHADVIAALVDRAVTAAERLLETTAIGRASRLDTRIWMLLWQLADRFGYVRPDGVFLDLPLTHGLIADLVAAQRPSVSQALGTLAAQGRVRRSTHGWVLTGPPADSLPQRR